MSSHIGTIQRIRGDQITIADINPALPDYRRQINAQVTGFSLTKGQRIRFDYNRRGEVRNLTPLDDAGNPLSPSTEEAEEKPQADKAAPKVTESDRRPQRRQPIEYHAYIAESDLERTDTGDWLHERTVKAIEHAITPQQYVKDQWQEWTLTTASSQIQRRQKDLVEKGIYDPIVRPEFHLNLLPKPSFAIAFRFTLAKPYLSGGEPELLPIDNPLVRDSTFGLPTIRESGWKGHLRQTMREILERFEDGKWTKDDDEDGIINRLFGHLDPETEGAHQGHLHFYPTFFDAISLEMINPHDRKARAGTVPILFESVPTGTSGNFVVLYTPLIGTAPTPDALSDEQRAKIAEKNDQIFRNAQTDLNRLVAGIHAMMRVYGFSAKATDGYGRAAEKIAPISEGFPMLQTNTKSIAPNQGWQTADGGQTFHIESFPTLTELSKIAK